MSNSEQYSYYHMGYCCFVEHEKLIKYYTDGHDVDEDKTTISGCGGQWVFTIRTGVASRYMDDSSSTISHTVASSSIQKYGVIRIGLISTKT